DHHGGDHGGDRDTDQVPQDSAAQDDIAGPNSRCELDRKLARLEELEREIRRQEIQRVGDQSEIEELKAKLGPELPIRNQRQLFQRALRALQQSDAPGTLEKEARSLKQAAVTDLVE